MSRLLPALGLAAFLAACGQAAPAPEPEAPAAAGSAVAEAVTAGVMTPADLPRVCRAGLATIHGQRVADIQIEGVDGEIVKTSWRAPVDGGRLFADCRVQGDVVTWRPTGLPDPAQERWMDTAGDPVVRFVLRGEEIEVNQTFPDGTREQAMLRVEEGGVDG